MRVCAMLFAGALAMHLHADDTSDAIARALHGDMFDQADVGAAFFFGNGVPQDYRQAYIWSAIAVESGMEDAITRRDKAASKLSPDDLAAAQTEVEELLKKIGGQ
jgi:hypothetical protein